MEEILVFISQSYIADTLIYLHGKINDTVFHTEIGLEYFSHLLKVRGSLLAN